ncbi:MAG: transposase [Oceanospirillaceae bacterium]|nr:transposase [Oceanospirillaceae bacterium]
MQPGIPAHNALFESLNGKFRNECIATDSERSTRHEWRLIYGETTVCNKVKLHSALGFVPPEQYSQ